MRAWPIAAVVGVVLFGLAGVAAARELMLVPGTVEVEDGDTLLIEIDGSRQRVQLTGIDAPEDTDNPKLQRDLVRTGLDPERLLALGRRSSQHLRGLIESGSPHSLAYEPERLDRYGRLVGELRDNLGNSLAEAMISAGYAMAGRDAPERFQVLQVEAKREGKGLWGLEPQATALWAGL